jgi:GNAT superfamily N-acetyltransferase
MPDVRVRVGEPHDAAFLADRERVPASSLDAILRQGRILLAQDHNAARPVAWLRWSLFWDEIPFMNLLWVEEARRRCGIGRLLVNEWESTCLHAGYAMVMTSTLSNESAQVFYRQIGYQDSGCLLLPGEPLEILFAKALPDS